MTVAVVVLNFNGAVDTIQCIRSLLESDYRDFRIVVVDNASTDDSVERLSTWIESHRDGDPGCELVVAERNGGYAAGNNIGIRHAYELEPTYLWILNNDTAVDPNALGLLVRAAEARPDAGALGCSVLDFDPPHAVQFIGGGRFLPLSTRQTYVGRGRAFAEVTGEPGPIDYVGGASMFCRSGAMQAVGGFSEDYFLFFEELDLARRLSLIGKRIAVEPEAIVYHRGAATTGVQSPPGKSALAAFHGARSCLIFLRRWHPLLVPNACFVRASHALMLSVRDRRLGSAALRGLRDGLVAPITT